MICLSIKMRGGWGSSSNGYVSGASRAFTMPGLPAGMRGTGVI